MTIIAAACFSTLSVVCGIILAFLLNLPAGGTIVIFNIGFLLLIFGAKKILPFQR
jgi:zinc transport system permease protein